MKVTRFNNRKSKVPGVRNVLKRSKSFCFKYFCLDLEKFYKYPQRFPLVKLKILTNNAERIMHVGCDIILLLSLIILTLHDSNASENDVIRLKTFQFSSEVRNYYIRQYRNIV